MYTQCPDCTSVFEISPEHLGAAGGMVRCGVCNTTFSALRRLTEKPPGTDTETIASTTAIDSAIQAKNETALEQRPPLEDALAAQQNETPAQLKDEAPEPAAVDDEATIAADEFRQIDEKSDDTESTADSHDSQIQRNSNTSKNTLLDNDESESNDSPSEQTPDNLQAEVKNSDAETQDEAAQDANAGNDSERKKDNSDDADKEPQRSDPRELDQAAEADSEQLSKPDEEDTPQAEDVTTSEKSDASDDNSDELLEDDLISMELDDPGVDVDAAEEALNELLDELDEDEDATKSDVTNPDDLFSTSQVLDEWDIDEGENDLEAILADETLLEDDTETDHDEAPDSDSVDEQSSGQSELTLDSTDDEESALETEEFESSDIAQFEEFDSSDQFDALDELEELDEEDLMELDLFNDTANASPNEHESEREHHDGTEDSEEEALLADSDASSNEALSDDSPVNETFESEDTSTYHEEQKEDADESSTADNSQTDASTTEPGAKENTDNDDSDDAENSSGEKPADESNEEFEEPDTPTDSNAVLTNGVDGQFDDYDNAEDLKDLGHYLSPKKSFAKRLGEGLAVIVLAGLLAAQFVHYNRSELATHPAVGIYVRDAYSALDMDLRANWKVADYRVARHTIVPNSEDANILMARATVVNNTDFARPLPLIRLQLENRWGDSIYGRVFTPAEYLEQATPESLQGKQRLEISLDLVNPAPQEEIGYSFDICLDTPQGPDCGTPEVFTE